VLRVARGEAYDPGCTRCPRLAEFLAEVHGSYPDYWARPVPSFGAADPRIVFVGLAPGLHGANRTGRPFTGDYAGELLYRTLYEAGLATRPESIAADDGLELRHARIINSVKCVPPGNKPLPDEIRSCNAYLKAELAALERQSAELTARWQQEMAHREEHLAQFTDLPEAIWEAHRRVAAALDAQD